MTIEPVTCYRCTECGRIYEKELREEDCTCKKVVYIKGKQYGPFVIIDKAEIPFYMIVRCILCGNRKEINYTNIKRQQSCGCKPYHIRIMSVEPTVVKYRCSKCKNIRIIAPPIVQYCCEETGDFLDD